MADIDYNPIPIETIPDHGWVAGDPNAEDTARFVYNPRAFIRPSITVLPNGPGFIWHGGIEGFDLSGSAELGIHKYMGDDAPVVQVTHLDDLRIALNGMFMGRSGAKQAAFLRRICTLPQPKQGKLLVLPYLMDYPQIVAVESYSFRRSRDDRHMDVEYSIQCVKIGNKSKKVKPKKPKSPQRNPHRIPRGKNQKVFTANSRYNTLRKIAVKLYKNGARWRYLYEQNSKWFTDRSISLAQAPDHRLPVGTKIYY